MAALSATGPSGSLCCACSSAWMPVALGVDDRQPPVEPRGPGELLLGGDLGVGLRQPELAQLELALGQLLLVVRRRVVLVEQLVAIVGLGVLLLLVLAFGQVERGILAPGALLALLGDPGERLLGLLELPLPEELERGIELGVGHGVVDRLDHRPPAVGAEFQRRARRIGRFERGVDPGRQPALEEVAGVGRSAGVGHLLGAELLEQVPVVGGAPLAQRADARAAAERDQQEDHRARSRPPAGRIRLVGERRARAGRSPRARRSGGGRRKARCGRFVQDGPSGQTPIKGRSRGRCPKT